MKVKERYANSVNITASGTDVIFSYYKETPEIEDEPQSRELVSRVRLSLPVALASAQLFQELIAQMQSSPQEESQHDA